MQSTPQGSASLAPTGMSGTTAPGFRAVEFDVPQRDGTVLLIAAYVAVWVILMGFVLAGSFKLRRLEARIARMERMLDRN